jgi:uncharacterized membrane protein
MGRNRWLKEQAHGWMERGIISGEQFQEITAGYPSRPPLSSSRIIFILAAFLIGLGIILFFAANWQVLPKIFKLGLIYTVIALAYYSGYRLYFEKGLTGAGFSLILLGNLSFGAGIWLTGQMFHMLSFNADGFLYWFIATALMAYLMKSALLMSLAIVLLGIYGVASASIYDSHFLFHVWLAAAVFPFLYLYRSVLLVVLSLAGLAIVSLTTFFHIETEIGPWFINTPLLGLALVALGQSTRRLIPEYTPALQGFGMALGFLGAAFLAFFPEHRWSNTSLHLAVQSGLLIVAAMPVFFKKVPVASIAVLTVFLPVYALRPFPDIPLDIVSAFVLGLFGIALIFAGNSLRAAHLINQGCIYFMLTVFLSYAHYAWGFMSKSFFFLGAGVILFLVAALLEHQRRQLVDKIKGGPEE